jgi:hypothetical protein
MDLLALATMKNVANCDKYCELQNSVNHRIFERTLRSLVFRGACLFENHFYPSLLHCLETNVVYKVDLVFPSILKGVDSKIWTGADVCRRWPFFSVFTSVCQPIRRE